MGLPTLYNSILVCLLFAPAWFNSLARANYSDFCPAGSAEIQVDSTSYTITCDRSYMVPLPIRVRDNATPEDCARVCTADPECHGIVWHADNCWQSNYADATTGTAAGAILLVPGETQEPVPEPVPNCQEQVGAAVATANTNCANQLETQLRNSDEIAANCDYGQTPYIRTIAGVRFRVWCNRYFSFPSETFQLGNTVGYDSCLALCAGNSRCMTVHYNAAHGSCSATPARRVPTLKGVTSLTFMRA